MLVSELNMGLINKETFTMRLNFRPKFFLQNSNFLFTNFYTFYDIYNSIIIHNSWLIHES